MKRALQKIKNKLFRFFKKKEDKSKIMTHAEFLAENYLIIEHHLSILINENLKLVLKPSNDLLMCVINDAVVFILSYKKGSATFDSVPSFIIQFYLFTPPDIVAKVVSALKSYSNLSTGSCFYSSPSGDGKNLKLQFTNFNKDLSLFSNFIADELSYKLETKPEIIN